MRWIDVSMPLGAGMPAFPGDPVFQSSRVKSLEARAPYNLSRFELGSHTGTHVDPPSHFVRDGAPIDLVPLDRLNGPCAVVEIPHDVRTVARALVEDVPEGTERVLFRTANSARWAEKLAYFPDYVHLDEEAARQLLGRGVRLVGIDALSIELDPDGRFPVHRMLLGRGVVIVEGLLLAAVPAGAYELACLPLRITGGDGGPARAAVRPL